MTDPDYDHIRLVPSGETPTLEEDTCLTLRIYPALEDKYGQMRVPVELGFQKGCEHRVELDTNQVQELSAALLAALPPHT